MRNLDIAGARTGGHLQMSNSIGTRQATSFSRRDDARAMIALVPRKHRGRRECRALAATHGPPAEKNAGGTTGSAETSRHSPRDGFNASFVLSAGTG
jgi:hypothetical protein